MNRRPSRLLPHLALPCSSPERKLPSRMRLYAQAIHTPQAATTPVATGPASAESACPDASHAGSADRAAARLDAGWPGNESRHAA